METAAEITMERADDNPRIMLIVPPGCQTENSTVNTNVMWQIIAEPQYYDFILKLSLIYKVLLTQGSKDAGNPQNITDQSREQ